MPLRWLTLRVYHDIAAWRLYKTTGRSSEGTRPWAWRPSLMQPEAMSCASVMRLWWWLTSFSGIAEHREIGLKDRCIDYACVSWPRKMAIVMLWTLSSGMQSQRWLRGHRQRFMLSHVNYTNAQIGPVDQLIIKCLGKRRRGLPWCILILTEYFRE